MPIDHHRGHAQLTTTLRRRFLAGLLGSRPQPSKRLSRVAGQLAGHQIAIYLAQETLERLEAGITLHALLDGRLVSMERPAPVRICVGHPH